MNHFVLFYLHFTKHLNFFGIWVLTHSWTKFCISVQVLQDLLDYRFFRFLTSCVERKCPTHDYNQLTKFFVKKQGETLASIKGEMKFFSGLATMGDSGFKEAVVFVHLILWRQSFFSGTANTLKLSLDIIKELHGVTFI